MRTDPTWRAMLVVMTCLTLCFGVPGFLFGHLEPLFGGVIATSVFVPFYAWLDWYVKS